MATAAIGAVRNVACSTVPAGGADALALGARSAAGAHHVRPNDAVILRGICAGAVRSIAVSRFPAVLALANVVVALAMTRAEVRTDAPLRRVGLDP